MQKTFIILFVLVMAALPVLTNAESTPEREYVNLPELMKMNDGTSVATAEEFPSRRKELLNLFAETMYGPIPTEDFETAFEVLEEGDTLDGTAIRKQIRMTVTTEKGSCDALMLLVLPKSEKPVPVVFGLSFSPVHNAFSDPNVLASYTNKKYPTVKDEERGSQEAAWCIAEAVQRGYGIALASCEDFMQDNLRQYGKRVISLFDKGTLSGLSAWAFGLERMADYLVTDDRVDFARLAVVGTSRLGKAALWAGANDERIALVIPNVSGTCGAAMSRSNTKEQVADLNANFRWWMNDTFKSFNDRVDELPVDQHELIACVAPRKVYISSAETDTSNDSQGTWNALLLSRDAFRLYGLEVIEDVSTEQPQAGEHVFTESMGYHMRAGNHGITPEDWKLYFDYMDQYLK